MTIEFDRLCAESVPVPAFVRTAQKAAASLIIGKGTEKDLDHLLLLFRTAETLLKKGSLQESAEKLRLYEGACAAVVMARGRPFDSGIKLLATAVHEVLGFVLLTPKDDVQACLKKAESEEARKGFRAEIAERLSDKPEGKTDEYALEVMAYAVRSGNLYLEERYAECLRAASRYYFENASEKDIREMLCLLTAACLSAAERNDVFRTMALESGIDCLLHGELADESYADVVFGNVTIAYCQTAAVPIADFIGYLKRAEKDARNYQL